MGWGYGFFADPAMGVLVLFFLLIFLMKKQPVYRGRVKNYT
jgi:hypothetical protein